MTFSHDSDPDLAVSDYAPSDSVLKRQLLREITCLERQVERLRARSEFADEDTLQTYAEMIRTRRKMLHNLPWEE